MMPSDKAIQEAIDYYEKVYDMEVVTEHTKNLIALAQLHLQAASELPERMKEDTINLERADNPTCVIGEEFNQCLDLCIPILARLKAENEELKQELEACRDANVQKKKRIAELEDALKRAEGE